MSLPPGHRRFGTLVTLAALAAIAVATLPSNYGPQVQPGLACVFCGDRALADALVNIILFAPLGCGLALRGTPLRRAILIGALMSALVECAQLVIPGRDPSLGDVIFNTLGTGMGIGLVWFVGELAHLDDRTASRLSIAAALEVTVTAVITGFLLRPALPHSTYYGGWTPNLGNLDWYRGRVQDVKIAGREVRSQPIDDTEWVRTALLRGDTVEVDFAGGPPVSGLAPVFSIHDGNQQEIFLVGPDQSDLVLRYRTRATAWLLDQPDLRVPGGWPSLTEGAVYSIEAWKPNMGSWCIRGPVGEHCELGYTLGAGWGVLYYAEWFPAWVRQVLAFGWIAALLIPTGYLLRARWESVVALLAVTLAFATLPGVMALRPTTNLEWLGALMGLLAGISASVLLRRRIIPRAGNARWAVNEAHDRLRLG